MALMIIFHGENIVQSRDALLKYLDEAKVDQIVTERLTAKELEPAFLQQKLQKTDLFGHERLLVIEELHSLPKSAKQKALINLVNQSSMPIVLLEKRQLTPTMLKQFPLAEVREFKLANSLFAWLDSFSPMSNTLATQLKLLAQALRDNDPYSCSSMLARQIRLLIQAKEGRAIKGPAFVQQKIARQAAAFSLEQLLAAHHLVCKIDQNEKTSSSMFSMAAQLEQLVVAVTLTA